MMDVPLPRYFISFSAPIDRGEMNVKSPTHTNTTERSLSGIRSDATISFHFIPFACVPSKPIHPSILPNTVTRHQGGPPTPPHNSPLSPKTMQGRARSGFDVMLLRDPTRFPYTTTVTPQLHRCLLRVSISFASLSSYVMQRKCNMPFTSGAPLLLYPQ
jgi:hypothetical protein